jgi:hypothetical protein
MILSSNSSNSSNVFCSNVTSSIPFNSSINYSTSVTSNVKISYSMPRCRVCKHGHHSPTSPTIDARGCYDIVGSSVTFVPCSCKEHVPEDNLEYLEYLTRKRESI